MLVLHALWSPPTGLCLWAEDSERVVKSTSQALRSARPHPYAVPADALAEHLGLDHGEPGVLELLLPSLRSAPLDSPEVVRVRPRPVARTEPTLLPWSVPVMCLTPTAAHAWLSRERATTAVSGAAIRYAPSVGQFAEVAGLAGELVERGRILPTLDHDGPEPVARWRPVLQGPDLVLLGALAQALPPVCRALPGLDDAYALVSAALQALTDATVRERVPPAADLLPARRGRRPRRLPAAEAWLSALTAPDGRFDAAEDELETLGRALAPWTEVGAGVTGPVRAVFRLSEDGGTEEVAAPIATDPRWRLEFWLQSTQDESVLVPAEQVWRDDGGLRRWLDRPQELLLGELGRASRVYPELAPGLRHATPTSIELDVVGAHHFLATAAPALDEAGFGVRLPSWWDKRARLGLNLSASTPVDGVVEQASRFGRDQLMDFRWQLAVGEESLTDDEIAALAETKAPLIRLRGQWVAVDPDHLRRGLDFLRRSETGQATVGELLAIALRHPADGDTPLPVTAVRADGPLGALLDGSAGQTLAPVPAPAGLTATLRPYQERGLSWLAFMSALGLGACLADDMGLGKTVQLLALECAQRTEEPGTGPTLLICPMSLVGNWQREGAKFAPELRIHAHHGRDRLRGESLREQLAATDLMVTTYATATRDIDELAGIDWHRVVLDEAQAIKNSLSRTAKAVRRLSARHRVALTGTPVENRLAELWSLMDFLNPGMLGSSESFRARYAIPVERYGEAEPAQRLRSVTRPYVLRRLKTDPTIIDDLPEKIEIKQYCQLTVEQASLYRSVVDEMMEKIEGSDGIERRGNVLATMTKLKQVCNHPAQVLHDRSQIGHRSGKVHRLEEILEEILAEGDRVLCFTQFTEFAELLLPHLSARFGTDVSYLHGGTPKLRRDRMVADFQSGDGPPIFLLSLKAGGTGLNLTAANHVIHLDRWWNPAVENQATDRAFRIGQRRTVEVHKLICTGTLEERIDDMITEKKALADLVIRDGEGWLTELSTTDLRQVFALSEEAVGE